MAGVKLAKVIVTAYEVPDVVVFKQSDVIPLLFI